MTSVISTTFSNTYLYFLPITTWCWNKIGVDVVCFMPNITTKTQKEANRFFLAQDAILRFDGREITMWFEAPEHKEATYAQCSRLYGACLDLPEDEILITSDIDMMMFEIPPYKENGFTIFGTDLVPLGQFPICYISASVKDWRRAFAINGRSPQQCLDDLLGEIECDNMRGNYWGKDQEEAFLRINNTPDLTKVKRAREGTQFATKRYDRDDSFILDRLSPETIDYHMNRPGYEDKNFEIIMQVLKFHYPQEDFTWLVNYNKEYKKLL